MAGRHRTPDEEPAVTAPGGGVALAERPRGGGDQEPAARRRPWWPTVRTYLGVAVILIWGLAPFYWMVIVAFRQQSHTYDTTPWPTHLTLQNFADALDTSSGNNFLGAIVNSLVIGAVTTVIALLFGIFTAYALARIEFRGKFLLTGVILGAAMFPPVALVTPLFQLFGNLGDRKSVV